MRSCSKALAKDTAERYPDAESFLRDLEAVESRLDRGPVDTESTAVFAPLAVACAHGRIAAAGARRRPRSCRPPGDGAPAEPRR